MPLVAVAMSTVSMPLSFSLKKTNLRVCLQIVVIAPAAILKETVVVFDPSGSYILHGVMTLPAPRCAFKRKSRLHGPYGYGNHSVVLHVVCSSLI